MKNYTLQEELYLGFCNHRNALVLNGKEHGDKNCIYNNANREKTVRWLGNNLTI
jgi:hypothetical protein